MRKLKIYLDTSVVSHLDQQDVPERMAETHKLWKRIKANEYEVVMSDVTIREMAACEESKRDTLFEYLDQIKYEVVAVNERMVEIAGKIVDLGILRQKSYDDCQHIAAAVVSECDVIVSWNFSHIVNPKTINGVKAVTALEGYRGLLIYTPSILAGGEDNDT
ncbi:hypothetical protein FACS18949_16740 [Clostridia bacterium]|nr:hypothetical protein FACS189425_07500 [Clostridia bacterium]GHV36874.1 hypothetical protein FACS18949_16740 [Clostridia bacterium]